MIEYISTSLGTISYLVDHERSLLLARWARNPLPELLIPVNLDLMELSIIGYDPIGAWQREATTIEELLEYRNSAGLSWINIRGLKDAAAISKLVEAFAIHPLTVEDILDAEQRPKAEEFDNYLFITFKSLKHRIDKAAGKLDLDQISLILTTDMVITFQESQSNLFEGIRRRIMNNVGKIRRAGVAYTVYAIINAVVDEYFLELDRLGNAIEVFEDRALDENDNTLLADIQRVKQALLEIRRVIRPLREGLNVIMHLDSELIAAPLEPFFKDLHDSATQVFDNVELFRELLDGVMEVHLASISNRMNKIMQVLTIIATIFIPLTFIVGVYGMNFMNMPELEYPNAYPIVWGLMILIAIGMIIFFKRRHWL
ncbi:MAG: magnesium/cobalt transporter CorA [Treponema sp.]|nr:magnesium/cobalt transporter CorA [Treponema sp.]